MRFTSYLAAFVSFAFVLFSQSALSQNLIYEGTLYDADGSPISEPNVLLLAEVLEKNGTCVLYERRFTVDLSSSKGYFSIDLNTGTAPTGEPHSATTLTQALSNKNGNSLKCSDNSDKNFTGVAEQRKIRLTVLEVNSVDIDNIQLPIQTLNVLPVSKEAESSLSLQGIKVDATAPNNGQVLRYNATNSRYEPSDVVATSIPWASVLNIPADIADGDNQLSEATVDGYADNNGYLKTQSLDGAYDDGSTVTVDSTDMIFNLSGTQDLHIQDAGSPALTVLDSGNVGVGTNTPQSKLQVDGYVQLDTTSGAPAAADCDAAGEYGRSIVDPTSGAFYVCIASGWADMSNRWQ